MDDRHRWRRGRRDFWRAWREERRRCWHCDQTEAGPPEPPPEVAHAWREFFHRFMGAWPEDHWAFGGRRFSPWHQGIDSFNPFLAAMLSKGGGLLPLVVLNLLAGEPRYGNEIMTLITERTGGQWVANPGAVYPLMALMEERGFVDGEWDDPIRRTVRIYRLTDAGRHELARLKAIVRPKLVETVEVLQALIDDLDANGADATGSRPGEELV